MSHCCTYFVVMLIRSSIKEAWITTKPRGACNIILTTRTIIDRIGTSRGESHSPMSRPGETMLELCLSGIFLGLPARYK